MIPFVRDFDVEYGRIDRLTPLIRRVIADNPGPFTYTGTGVYIIGAGDEIAVIDPGPDMGPHFASLKRAIGGRRVSHVLVTHSHMDHSPLARPLAAWAGCEVWAGGSAIASDGTVRGEAGDDLAFYPDRLLVDGQIISGQGWTIEALATPGHTAAHFCFALLEENALFSGDHVMGWSTTVISPPDGHMGRYMDSLDKIRARGFSCLWPTHGPPVTDPEPFLTACIAHRRDREKAIIARLKAGDEKIIDIVRAVYADVRESLHPAAFHSVLAHLIHLHETGRVEMLGNGRPSALSRFHLPPPKHPTSVAPVVGGRLELPTSGL